MRKKWLGMTFFAALAAILLVALPPADAKAKDPAKAPAAARVDLNSASQADLEALPGVGSATAKKIIAGRPYSSVADLSKAGVSAKTIDKITPLVTVGAASAAAAPMEKPARVAKAAPAAASAAPTEKPAKAAKAAPAASAGPVDLNSASQKDLEALPAVGAATAKKIIAGRPYSSVADLSKAGVSAKTIETITPLVTVGKSTPASTMAAPLEKPARVAHPGAVPAAPSSAPPANVQAQTPPLPGMVWVNTATRVFHREGDPWYGKTKQGKFMTEADALKAGYRASKEGAPKK
jgi:DNA uptake protein ComE-like DNA-binding protein